MNFTFQSAACSTDHQIVAQETLRPVNLKKKKSEKGGKKGGISCSTIAAKRNTCQIVY